MQAWGIIRDADSQARIAGFGVTGLDIGALLALGRASGCDTDMLAAALPHVQGVIVRKLNEQLRGA